MITISIVVSMYLSVSLAHTVMLVIIELNDGDKTHFIYKSMLKNTYTVASTIHSSMTLIVKTTHIISLSAP
jgi:hypothetical protein